MGKKLIIFAVLILVSIGGYYLLTRLNEENFKAPGKTWNSSKKVEDYFIERLHMPVTEAAKIRDQTRS